MIKIDSSVFTFVGDNSRASAELMTTLRFIDWLTQSQEGIKDVVIEPVYADAGRLYVQGKAPEILKRIQALKVTTDFPLMPITDRTIYIRSGATSVGDVYDTMDDLLADDALEAERARAQ